MAHTLAPWTSKHRLITVFGQIDNSELAARLGSPSLKDRRGNVQFIDSFEGTSLKWTAAAAGTGADVSLTNEESYIGDQSVKLITGNAAGNVTSINRSFPAVPSTRVGIEVYFLIDGSDAIYQWWLFIYDGTNRYQMKIKLDQTANEFAVAHGNTSWTVFESDPSMFSGDHLFHNLKLVADTSTNKYVRVIIDQTQYDISDIAVFSAADATDPRIYAYLNIDADENSNIPVYYDGVILTINET